MNFNRRNWLKTTGLIGAAGMFSGWNSISEDKYFHPRELKGPVKLNSNENPYGPSEMVRKAMQESFDLGCRYPSIFVDELRDKIARKEGVSKDMIVITGGSTEGLKITGLSFGLYGGEIIAPRPTFLAMMNYAKMFGARVTWVDVDQDLKVDLQAISNRVNNSTKLIFLCNPNNPTSDLLPADEVKEFCDKISERVMVFSDEAYYDFIEEENYPSMVELVKQGKNVIVSRTFSKVYGLAGLRIGYLIARPDLAEKLRDEVVAFTNVLAIQAAIAALDDNKFYDYALQKNKECKKLIYSTLDDLGLRYIKSHTNFVFFHSGRNITELQADMKKKEVFIGRPFPPFYDWCRISTGTVEEVKIFCETLKTVMKS